VSERAVYERIKADILEAVEEIRDECGDAAADYLLEHLCMDEPTQVWGALSRGGIETIDELLDATVRDLMWVPNLGAKGLCLIFGELSRYANQGGLGGRAYKRGRR
jgi:DNA-directed RNA polymerase alpha subunit